MSSRLLKIGLAFTAICAVGLLSSLFMTGFLDRERVEDVLVEVDYFDHWNMTVSESSYSWSFSGFGRMERCFVRVDGDVWVISVEAQKEDSSSGQLAVRVKLRDGTVLKQASTSEPFGKVSFTIEIK